MTLQIEDRTMLQPEGVLEDVLIKVGKFIFPVDFVFMDMDFTHEFHYYLEDHSWPLELP